MTAAGWYKDRDNGALARWHDGQGWTEHTMVMADWAGPGQPPPPMQAAFASAPPPISGQASAPPPPTGYTQPASRQSVRVDAATAKARAKAMRPWYRKKRVILPAALVVLVLIIAASSGGGKKNVATGSTGSTVRSVNSGSHPAADDVAITSCENQSYGTIKVGVTIVNHTSKTSNYLVSINVNDATGTKVGDGNASTENLGAGQTAKVDGYATASSSTSGAISCITASVTRYAS